ncbi:DEAD/DEAH box helicase [Paenibacillus sp. An7]|uniref:DEAD/DEAH box helicase n=1 Tax=Paenibacillus sp. An7 TaxID=2689577 RepID=UPI001F1846A6|nr:helicase-related protein [Paenibacillus sp. An7]
MKVAVYLAREEEGDPTKSDELNLYISICPEADQLWWEASRQKTKEPGPVIWISSQMPFSWACHLRESFRKQSAMLREKTSVQSWRRWTESILQEKVSQEPGKDGMKLLRECLDIKIVPLRGTSHAEELIHSLYDDAVEAAEQLAGRQLLLPEAEALLAENVPSMQTEYKAAIQLGYLAGRITYEAAVAEQPTHKQRHRFGQWLVQGRRVPLYCRRCGSIAAEQTPCAACGSSACAYCEACLALGRSRACALLLQGAAPRAVKGAAGRFPTAADSRWGLSPAQSVATGAALAYLAEQRHASSAAAKGRFLLWAVTGAGKTEMTFPLLDAILSGGGSVLVATPRRDVVLELAPRVARAFPEVTRATLYGGSSDRWRRGELTLATTHQLLRFRHAFDLVIIDELDAFPYHNDPMLAYAAEACCKQGGSFIYLSATPPRELQKQAASGKLAHARVPVRFHRHPLPVPLLLKVPSVQQLLKQHKLPAELLRRLAISIERGAQIFMFVTRIAQIDALLHLLRRTLPDLRIEGTSSVDPLRAEKVMAFRDRTIRLLVTTTILERGVTVPKSDVYILDANNRLFDAASLVQMAGRAGRSKDDPAGNVVFAAPERSLGQKEAVKQIKRMNTIARRQGYLLGEET